MRLRADEICETVHETVSAQVVDLLHLVPIVMPIVTDRVTGWVRIQRKMLHHQNNNKATVISILMGAKMQGLKVVRGRSEFLSQFSLHVPQAIPTQPVR